MFKKIREDIAIVFERDPAARSTLEVLTTYPGVHALLIHRVAHAFWRIKLYWLGRFISHIDVGLQVLKFIQARLLVVVFLLIMAWGS
jgi:serine acetyltransferase